MTTDPTTIAKLDELLGAIRAAADPRRAADEWKQVFRLLGKAGVPGGQIAGIVGMRDANRLSEVLDQLRGTGQPAPTGGGAIDDETLKRALRVFKKRSALTRLDEESRLGRSPLSKGENLSAAAISPPTEFPDAVWQELVRQGRLKYLGHGLYELKRTAESGDRRQETE